MVHSTDKMLFKVFYKINDTLVVKTFNSFASAAGHASGLDGLTRFLDVEFSSEGSSISGSLYVYSKTDNTRRKCNEYLINEVLKRGV